MNLNILLLAVGYTLLMSTLVSAQDIDVPKFLECIEHYGLGGHPAEASCKLQFALSAQRLRENLGLDRNEIKLLWGLGAEIQRDVQHRKLMTRKNKNVRRECRAMGEWERRELFDAINYLKKNTSNPNVYLTLAKLHRGSKVYSHAHVGSNFMGWHRVYLLYFEKALQRVNKYVALCYWDSTIDFRLGTDEWTRTLTFSDSLFGSSNGEITDGPFRHWYLPRPYNSILRRNILPWKGIPFDSRAAELILTSNRLMSHSSITVGGSRFETITNHLGESRDVTLEGEHDNVHVWVGDHMGSVDTAPYDPVFFFHHCFIDYLWEEFRKKMMRFGLDPSHDYPGHGNAVTTSPDYPMIGFNWYRNIDGYSNTFTDEIYTYEATPTCFGRNSNCRNSPFMECYNSDQCVAKTKTVIPEAFSGNNSQFTSNKHAQIQRPLTVTGRSFVANTNSD